MSMPAAVRIGEGGVYINLYMFDGIVQDFVRMKKQPLLYPRVMGAAERQGTFYFELVFSYQRFDVI
jgi:hypothetical protein